MTANLFLLNHPVLQHKLFRLRDQNLSTVEFRLIFHELSSLVAYEATRDLVISKKKVNTSLGQVSQVEMQPKPVVIAIMRAGNEMVDPVLKLLSDSSVGHIGIYRDRLSQHTIEYYLRLPVIEKQTPLLLLDPVLGTGDTMLACIERLQQFSGTKITVVCLLVSQVGVDKIHHFHPEISIYAIGKENDLSPEGFLIPGIGDVSNRLYGIKDE